MDENQIWRALLYGVGLPLALPLVRLAWRGLVMLPLYCLAYRLRPGRLRAALLGLFYWGPSRQNQELKPGFSWRDEPYYGRGSWWTGPGSAPPPAAPTDPARGQQ
jgi:hypothetical protein